MTSKHIAQILRPHRLRAAGWLLAATLGMMSVLPAVAAGPAASSAAVITVEGNRRVDAETIRSYFHSGTDGQFDEAAATREIELFDGKIAALNSFYRFDHR